MKSFKPGDILVPVRKSVDGNHQPELDTTSFDEVKFIRYLDSSDNGRFYDIKVIAIDKPIKYRSHKLTELSWFACDFKLKYSRELYPIT